MHEVIALRAHKPDRRTQSAHKKLVRLFGSHNVYVVADEVTSPAQQWPSVMNVIRLTTPLLESLGLRSDLRDSGWRCGDYCQAALFNTVDADRVWMFENDVVFSRITAKDFVSYFDDDDADYISYGVSPLRKEGFWAGTLNSRGFQGQEWHSFYPVTRVSRAASDAAVKLRQQVQHHPSPLMQPNDETIMATATVDAGLTVSRLEEQLPFTLRRFSPGRPVPYFILATLYRGPQMFHPVGPLRRKQRRTVEDVTAPQE